MLAAMNEGEDETYATVRVPPSEAQLAAQQAAQQARSDPAAMLELMRASDSAQRAKKQRLASLVRSSTAGAGSADADFAEPMARPHHYKREQAAREAAEPL